jgi:hypothetical protein
MCRRPDRACRGHRAPLAALALASLLAGRASAEPAPEPAPSYTTVVRVPGGPPQAVGTAVDAAAARKLPGTGGDPSLAAQDLPGIARAAPGATGLVIWGAAPAESRVLFDGVEIPALTHFGGFRSTVGAELVGRIDVVPGAYGADYGRALGGLVRIEPRPLETSGSHLVVDANLLDGGVAWRGGVGRLRIAAAARTSYLDQTYGRVLPASTLDSTSAQSLFPIPRYSDAQVAAALPLGDHATLRATALASFDRVRRDLGGGGAGLPARSESQRADWWRAVLIYDERGDDDGLGATLFAGGDQTSDDQQFGAAPASQSISSRQVGLRARYRARLGEAWRLSMGLDGWLQSSGVRRAGSLTIPAREGDLVVFGQPPGDDVNADRWSATVGDVAPYASVTFTHGAWSVTPGLRADAFPVDGSRTLPPIGATPVIGYAHLSGSVDPRLAVAYAITPALIATAAGGVYHQPVDAADLSAVFGSPSLAPGRALHATLSLWAKLAAHTTVEGHVFYRRLDHLAVRSPMATPVLAAALISDGRGRSAGLDLMLRRELARGTQGWLTYTLSRSERWTGDGPVRLLDFDQTHVLTAVASHQRAAWTFSGRVRYATGMPRTPVAGSFTDLRDGTTQPIFDVGAQNSVRLPAFFQLDARVDRTLVAGPVGVTLYLDAQNLTGRRNPEEIVYTRDFTSSAYLTGPPLLVLLGVRIES